MLGGTPSEFNFKRSICKISNRIAGARNQDYQLTDSHLNRLQTNVERLVKSMDNFNLDFLDSEKVYNIVSKAILELLETVLEHEKICKK